MQFEEKNWVQNCWCSIGYCDLRYKIR